MPVGLGSHRYMIYALDNAQNLIDLDVMLSQLLHRHDLMHLFKNNHNKPRGGGGGGGGCKVHVVTIPTIPNSNDWDRGLETHHMCHSLHVEQFWATQRCASHLKICGI